MTTNSPRDKREQALLLAKTLAERQASDPLLNWKALPKQKPFIDAVLQPGTSGEWWFIASNRSGKSEAGSYIGAQLARFGDPDAKYDGYGAIQVKDRATAGWVAGVDFPTLRDVLQPKYFDNGNVPPGATHEPFIPKREVLNWRRDDNVLKLRNGSLIAFKSYDSGRTKFQGAERNWIHFDEEMPKDIYEECIIRVGATRLRIFGTLTLLPPEGQVGGVSWMFPEIIQPWQEGKRKDVQIFGASIYDNPFIPREEIARMESKYPLGSVQRRIRLDGEWLPGLGGSRAFPGFDRRIHVSEQPPINPWRPLCWCWDFNVEPLITTIGQRDGAVFRVHDELMLDEGSIPDMCQMFYDRYPRHGTEVWIYGDATGQNRSAHTNMTSYAIILNTLRQYSLALRLKVPSINPPVTDRINATNMALKGPDGEQNVSIAPHCHELILDYEMVLADNKGGIKKTSNPKDPYYRRTHAIDGHGYWLAYEAPVMLNRTSHSRSAHPLAQGGGKVGYGFNTRGER